MTGRVAAPQAERLLVLLWAGSKKHMTFTLNGATQRRIEWFLCRRQWPFVNGCHSDQTMPSTTQDCSISARLKIKFIDSPIIHVPICVRSSSTLTNSRRYPATSVCVQVYRWESTALFRPMCSAHPASNDYTRIFYKYNKSTNCRLPISRYGKEKCSDSIATFLSSLHTRTVITI